jgi:hypothetical protein
MQTYVVFFFFALFVMAVLLLVWKDFFGVDRKACLTQSDRSNFGNHFESETLDVATESDGGMRQVVPTDLVCQMGILPCGALTQDD